MDLSPMDYAPATHAATPPVFDATARAHFARCYPETPHALRHGLDRHDLLTLPRLAELGERLPAASVEYNRGDLPIGVDGKPTGNGLTIAQTILQVETARSWAVLKNVEQDPAYAALLHALLAELADTAGPRTGAMLTPQAFVFISSPDAVTPYHFDPEHNILLQVSGHKVMTQFPAGDPAFAPDTVHESYHAGGGRELVWNDAFAAGGTAFPLGPGDAVYVPVMAPHFVRNGAQVSLSLSITWRSEWSYAEADARAFNGAVRRIGLVPHAPRRWPSRNRGKALAGRALRRLGLTRRG